MNKKKYVKKENYKNDFPRGMKIVLFFFAVLPLMSLNKNVCIFLYFNFYQACFFFLFFGVFVFINCQKKKSFCNVNKAAYQLDLYDWITDNS